MFIEQIKKKYKKYKNAFRTQRLEELRQAYPG